MHIFSDCCEEVNFFKGSPGDEEKTLEYDHRLVPYKKVPGRNDLDIKDIQYLTHYDGYDYVIWYDPRKLGWAIGHFDGLNKSTPSNHPDYITERDPSAFQKCPHDSSLTWRHYQEDASQGMGDEIIGVKCSTVGPVIPK